MSAPDFVEVDLIPSDSRVARFYKVGDLRAIQYTEQHGGSIDEGIGLDIYGHPSTEVPFGYRRFTLPDEELWIEYDQAGKTS